jgi:glycosyltransferase involved in cell wall biosynthesis
MTTVLPRVSVLIATYDRPHYLAGAIASVLRGSYADFEVIVSDDAGPPRNQEVVAAFRDRRVHYRRNPERLGIAGNHLAAAREARGDYVAILNDDDEWEPEMLATLAPILDRNPSVSVAFADHQVIDAFGVIDAAATKASSRRWKRDQLGAGLHRQFWKVALIDQSLAIVAALFRRKVIDWCDFPFETGAAYDLWLSYLACRGDRSAWYVPERLARYRAHPASETALSQERTARAAIFVYARLCGDLSLSGWHRVFADRLKFAQLTYALALLDKGDATAARRHLWSPLLSKYGARTAIALALSFTPGKMRASLIRGLRSTKPWMRSAGVEAVR